MIELVRGNIVDQDVDAIVNAANTSISTGAYRYPVDEAAPIALGTVLEHLKATARSVLVRFVLFDHSTHDAYQRALTAVLSRR